MRLKETDLEQHLEFRKRLNKERLSNIILELKNGESLDFSDPKYKEAIEEYVTTGLNNIDFFKYRWWENKNGQ